MSILKELYNIINKKQRLNEMKVPSKFKRWAYDFWHDKQPEDVIQSVRSLSDSELMFLHRANLRDYEDGKLADRGTPRYVQARAIAREIKRRKLEWPTIDPTSPIGESKQELTKNIKKTTPSKTAGDGSKKNKPLKVDVHKIPKKKDRPYMKEPKRPQHVGGNMWFDMTRSGERAGDQSITEAKEDGFTVWYSYARDKGKGADTDFFVRYYPNAKTEEEAKTIAKRTFDSYASRDKKVRKTSFKIEKVKKGKHN